jgi:hypothetical protein
MPISNRKPASVGSKRSPLHVYQQKFPEAWGKISEQLWQMDDYPKVAVLLAWDESGRLRWLTVDEAINQVGANPAVLKAGMETRSKSQVCMLIVDAPEAERQSLFLENSEHYYVRFALKAIVRI